MKLEHVEDCTLTRKKEDSMKKSAVLEKLQRREPLFTQYPLPHSFTSRIMGLEIEFGGPSLQGDKEPAFLKQIQVPRIFHNGGRVYIDIGFHLEGCTPECDNLVSLVAYFEALKMQCRQLRDPPLLLYCHNRDFQTNPATFGFHENFFTCAPRESWWRLIPFLVARTVLAGTGSRYPNGNFGILQRAPFLDEGISDHPYKTVITSREEKLSNLPQWDRLHLLLGDSPMCPMTLFLSVGFTSLVVEMLEQDALPSIDYEHITEAVSDIRAISGRTQDWTMRGITRGPKLVVELLSLYLQRAKQIFGARDSITTTLLWALEDTLEKLGKNPMQLFGRLDWVTKLYLLNEFNRETSDNNHLMAQDLEYHSLDPLGLHRLASKMGLIERVVSRSLIKEAIGEPPPTTRAFLRGNIARAAQREFLNRWKPNQSFSPWDTIAYQWAGEIPRGRNGIQFPIGNPFKNYAEALPGLLKTLRS